MPKHYPPGLIWLWIRNPDKSLAECEALFLSMTGGRHAPTR